MTLIKQATLVYQGGIANVFDTGKAEPVRLIQADFRTCEAFARGIKATGVPVHYAWCNQAGDIGLPGIKWNYEAFGDMPFFESISRDFEVS